MSTTLTTKSNKLKRKKQRLKRKLSSLMKGQRMSLTKVSEILQDIFKIPKYSMRTILLKWTRATPNLELMKLSMKSTKYTSTGAIEIPQETGKHSLHRVLPSSKLVSSVISVVSRRRSTRTWEFTWLTSTQGTKTWTQEANLWTGEASQEPKAIPLSAKVANLWIEEGNVWAASTKATPWDPYVGCVRLPRTRPATWTNTWRPGRSTSLVNCAVLSIRKYQRPSTSGPVLWQLLNVRNASSAQHRKEIFRNTLKMCTAGWKGGFSIEGKFGRVCAKKNCC